MKGLHFKELYEGMQGAESIPSTHPTLGARDGDRVLVLGGASGEDILSYNLAQDDTPATSIPDTIASSDGLAQLTKVSRGYKKTIMPGIDIDCDNVPAGWALAVEGPLTITDLARYEKYETDRPVAVYFNGVMYFATERKTFGYDFLGDNQITDYDDMPTPSINTDAAYLATAVRFDDGWLHQMGNGSSAGATDEHFAFDCTAKAWSTLEPMPLARRKGIGFSAHDIDGKIYFAGGEDSSNVDQFNVFAYDPVADDWETKGNTPWSFTRGCRVIVPTEPDWVYLITLEGGLCRYKPSTDSWEQISDQVNTSNYNGTIAFHDAVTNNIVIVFSDDIYTLNLDTTTRTIYNNVMPYSPGAVGACDLGNGRFLFVSDYKEDIVSIFTYRDYLKIVKG